MDYQKAHVLYKRFCDLQNQGTEPITFEEWYEKYVINNRKR